MSPRQLRAVWEAGLGLPMDVWSTKSKSRVHYAGKEDSGST